MWLLATGCIPWKLPSTSDGGHDADARADVDAVADSDVDIDADADADADDSGPDGSGDADADLDVMDDVIARYSFEGNVEDSVGSHHAVMHDDSVPACMTMTLGREDDNRALFFSPGCNASYLQIEDDDEWDQVKSIDFWLSFSEFWGHRGLLSRDARNTMSAGHFTIWVTNERRIVVRHERSSIQSKIFCSSSILEYGEWIHVGINLGLGGFELWISGVLQDGVGSVGIGGISGECNTDGSEWTHGIGGNENPWVIGASLVRSDEGSAEPREHYARALAIDELRMGRERRDYAAFP